MSETTADPSAAAGGAAPAIPLTKQDATSESQTASAIEETKLSIKRLLEAGVHFGHQTRRWNPRMRTYIFGERDGIHILDLDQTLSLFAEALEFLRSVAAGGGKVLFVGTKRQAAPLIELE